MQVIGQPCDNGISTNPNNPINNQFVQMGNDFFPLNAPVDTYNPFLNSFDWYFGNNTIQLFPDEVNWVHFFSSFTNPVNMQHPFGGSMPTEFQYLRPDSVNPAFRDFRWEDGWELLYMNLGYFPDLNHTDNPAPGSYYANHNQSYDPIPSNIPYFVLYNRYRGLLRLFANVWYPIGSNFEDINVTIQFTEPSSAFQKVTGLLRHASAFDLPLSEETSITAVHAPRYHAPNYTQWIVADFQMAYDPCTCQSQGELEFRFTAFSSLDVDIIGRSVSLEVPINDTTYTTRDFMNLSNINTNDYESGTEIYQNLDRMLDEYEKQQRLYLEQLEEYNNYNTLQSKLFRFGVKTVVKVLTKGVSEIVMSDSLATILLNDDISLVNGLSGIPASWSDLSGFKEILSQWVKEKIAESNNTLLMEVYGPAPSKPKPVAVPVATLEESVYKGTITGTDTTFSSPMVLPGSLPNAYYPPGTSLEPQRTPVYNEVLGQAALLETPGVLMFYEADTAINLLSYEDEEIPLGGGINCDITKEFRSKVDFKLRIDEALQIALNNVLDFDLEKTQTYVQVNLKLKNGLYVDGQFLYDPEDFNYYNLNQLGSNMYLERQFVESFKTNLEFNSEWVPLQDANQMVFQLIYDEVFEFTGTSSSTTIDGCDLPDPFDISFFDYEIEQLNIKLMHDMYFDQIGSSNEQVNTLQVFTYQLYDQASGINHLDSLPEAWANEFSSGTFDHYIPGEIVLGDETITTSHPLVNEVVGTDIIINAQKILIEGNLQVQSGYTLIVQALEEIKLMPNAIINPSVHLRIKEDFYSTPVFEYADSTSISDFCTSTLYQANVDAAAISIGAQNQGQPSEPLSSQSKFERGSVSLFPNPARDLLTLRSSHLDMTVITIYDLSGRPIEQQNLPNQTRQYQMSLSGIAPGTYIVRVDCDGKVFSEKLVVTR